jgi:opacity protein-like surface antigen
MRGPAFLGCLAFGATLAVVTLSASSASAQDAAAPPKKFESSAGLKLLAGGNVWTTPSDVPGGYDGLGFPGSGGGFGWGAAAYYEARFIQHLGLELDLGYDSSTLQRNVTYNGVVKVTEKVQMSGLRWGLLAKGIVPTPFGRLWLGLGPEFVSGSSVDASIEVKTDNVANKSQIESLISAKSKSSTMLTFGFGLAIHVGEHLEIPVDLRAAKNMSQDSKWTDRVKINPATSEYEVTAQSSWDFRLATGLGYRF